MGLGKSATAGEHPAYRARSLAAASCRVGIGLLMTDQESRPDEQSVAVERREWSGVRTSSRRQTKGPQSRGFAARAAAPVAQPGAKDVAAPAGRPAARRRLKGRTERNEGRARDTVCGRITKGRSPERARVVCRASGASDGVGAKRQRAARGGERCVLAANGSGRRRTGGAWTLRAAKARERVAKRAKRVRALRG